MNINKIKLSGTTYSIQDENATKTVELTQAQYDALSVKDPNTFYIITDATGGDLSNYYTKSETSGATEISTALASKADTATTYTKTQVDNAITAATSTKQDTLVSGTNIKTINNESILGSGNIEIEGGGGKAVSGGTNISITTGETADTINCTLNLENGTNSQSGGLRQKSYVASNYASGRDACAFGGGNKAHGTNSFVTGYYNDGSTSNAFVSGYKNETTNHTEILFGMCALSNGQTSQFNGNSGCTLFAVGNGEGMSETRHNALEVRQNGDIYIADTNDASTTNYYEKPMIKLQDALGGSSYTAGDGIDITNDVISVTGKVETSDFNTYTAATNSRLSEDEEVTAAGLNALNESKQDTLVSGTNIKTINNESILGSGNIDIQGGGKAIEAGRGISITTGETADTVSFSLPISAGTGTNSIIEGEETTATGYSSHAEGYNASAKGNQAHAEGRNTNANSNCSHAEGENTYTYGTASHAEGTYTIANNESEHASGRFNVSSKASNTFGDSGNTLFSVGNGTSNSARHNAFEIRQNGDIYITKDGQDIKLQDQLGGGSITVDTALDSGSTNPVENRVIYNKIDEVEQVTAAGLNALNDNFGGLKLMKISQTDYENLQVKDQNTLYIIVG